ncbi:MAG: PAS domain S-box protein [Thaumarchaeota archaeon]|nr:PAS domain S-box protein [Nitrososphaerota archaeon]
MKIGPKITITVLCFSTIILFMGLISISQINQIAEPLKNDIPNSINELTHTSELDGHAQFIRYYDEVLTQSARNYAFTTDPKWEKRYREAEPLLDAHIKDAIEHGKEIDKQIFSSIDTANLLLVEMEYRSIDLVNDGQNQDAIKLLESEEYWNQKKIYEDGLREYSSFRNLEYNEALQASTEVLTLTTENTQKLLEEGSNLIFSLLAVFIGAATVLGFIIYRSIVNPIQNLESAANKISSGQYVKIDLKGDDEIHHLAESINKMVSAQNKAKELVISSEKKFRQLYETSPDLYRSINTDGKILNCNERYAKSLQYSKGEIIGSSIFDHVSMDTIDEMKESFRSWKNTGISNNHEVKMRRRDGSTFPALISASSMYDEKGILVASNTTIKDLTEINKAREQVQEEKTKRLTAIGELSARIAHDLRNPMSVIKNTMELVEDELNVESSPSLSKKFKRINRAITRINHQVDNVLDFVKNKPLQFENTSLSSILDFVIEKINVPADVTINLPKNDTEIFCDFEKLEIVFLNLITNAIQAMSNRGEIDIRFTDEESQIIIEIEDFGPGIPEKNRSQIFDPLFTTRQVGTGLGLPSCKNIVEKHGGTIEMKSRIDEGTTFVIKLPKKIDLVTVDMNR